MPRVDWDARLFCRAGLVRDLDVMVGFAYQRSRRNSLDESYIPATLMIRILVWWVEFSYKSSKVIKQERDRIHGDR